MPDEGQAQAESATGPLVVSLVIGLEQRRELGRLEADSRVSDTDRGVLPRAARRHHDVAAGVRVGQRIAQQIVQDLRQPRRIGVDPQTLVGQIERNREPGRVGAGLNRIDRLLNADREIDEFHRLVDALAPVISHGANFRADADITDAEGLALVESLRTDPPDPQYFFSAPSIRDAWQQGWLVIDGADRDDLERAFELGTRLGAMSVTLWLVAPDG